MCLLLSHNLCKTGVFSQQVSLFLLQLWPDVFLFFAIVTNDDVYHDFYFSAIVPVAAATMTPLPLLAAFIVMKVRECLIMKEKEKIPVTEEDDQDISIIKTTMKMDHEMIMAESESKVKLVEANGDANENCLA